MAAEAEAHWDAMSQMPYWEAKTLVHLHEQGFATITTLEDFEAFRAKKLSAKTLMDAVVAVGGLEVHESANKKIRCTPGKCRRDELGIKVYKAYELENPADYKYDRETIFFSNGEETDFVPERICAFLQGQRPPLPLKASSSIVLAWSAAKKRYWPSRMMTPPERKEYHELISSQVQGRTKKEKGKHGGQDDLDVVLLCHGDDPRAPPHIRDTTDWHEPIAAEEMEALLFRSLERSAKQHKEEEKQLEAQYQAALFFALNLHYQVPEPSRYVPLNAPRSSNESVPAFTDEQLDCPVTEALATDPRFEDAFTCFQIWYQRTHGGSAMPAAAAASAAAASAAAAPLLQSASPPYNSSAIDCEAPGDEGSSSVKHEHQEDGGDEQTTVSTGMAGGAGKKKRTHPRASAGGLATGAASSSSSLSSSSSPSSGGGKGKRAKIAAAPTGAPSSHHSVGSSTAAFALLGIGGGAAGGGAAAAASGASGVAASSSAAASSAAASGPAAPPVTVPELLANIDSDLRSAGVADEERVKTSFARFGEAAEAYVQATGPEVKLRFIAANVAFNQLHESVAAEVGKLKAEREEGLAARAAAIQAHADGIPKLLVEQGLGDLVEAVVAAESAAPLEQRLAERTQLEADKAQAATAMAYCAAAPPGLSADHYASIQAEIKRLQQRVQAVEAELLVFPDPLALQETINEVKARFASLAEQREQLRKDEEAQQPDPSGRHVELFFSFMRGAF